MAQWPPLNTLLVIYISDIGSIFLKYSFCIYCTIFRFFVEDIAEDKRLIKY